MPRNRRKRLSWFKFYIDDFRGGTSLIPPRYLGQYLLALCAQWDSKTVQAIPNDPELLRLIFRGDKPYQPVLDKFEEVMVGDQKMLRNQRLAEEWQQAEAEVEGKARGGGRKADSDPDTAPKLSPTRARYQNPDTRHTESESFVSPYIEQETAETDISLTEIEGAVSLWLSVLRRLSETVPPHNFATWLRPTTPMGFSRDRETGERTLVVGVPGGEHRAHIWGSYGARLKRAVEEYAPGIQLRLVVGP